MVRGYTEGDRDSADWGPVLGDKCQNAIISKDLSFISELRGYWKTLIYYAGVRQ